MTGARTLTVEVAGAELYVQVRGDGAPLLSVSGSGTVLQDDDPASPLETRFTVAQWDHRGLGRSTAMDDDGRLRRRRLRGRGRPGVGPLSPVRPVLRRHGRSTDGRRAAPAARPAGPGLHVSGGEGGSSYPPHERPAPMVALSLVDTRPEALKEVLAIFGGRTPPGEPGYERQLQARRLHDVWDEFSQIMAPTLVTAGRFDGIAPPTNGEALATRIPGARFELFEGGHAFLYQDARAWPVITKFLLEETP